LLIARRSTGQYGPDLQRCPGTAHQPGGQQNGDKALADLLADTAYMLTERSSHSQLSHALPQSGSGYPA